MNSSTSSFSFLVKTIICAVLLTTLYSFAVKNLVFVPFFPQSQFQENKYKVERFLSQIKPETGKNCSIIVGSSLGARLREEYLPRNIVNLALSGGSAVTGLEFVLYRNIQFKKVYIDATILRLKDEEAVRILHDPFEMWRTTELTVGNIDRQPIALFSNFVRTKVSPSSEDDFNQKQFEQWLEFQKVEFGELKLKETTAFFSALDELKKQVHELNARNIQVVMLEMPIDARVMNLPLMKLYHDEIRKAFQHNLAIKWLSFTEENHYQTYDGVHVTTATAKSIAKLLD